MVRSLFINLLLIFLIVGMPHKYLIGQCAVPITHTAGTLSVGCTEVTVTSAGFAENGSACYGPYKIGTAGEGSYTFEFNPPIYGISFSVQSLDNQNTNTEEVSLEINGAFYPIVNPGAADNCAPGSFFPAVIWPPGVIRAQPGLHGSWQDININETISTLTITDSWVSGMPIGVLVSLYICCTACETSAGEMVANALDLCPNEVAILPPAIQTVLDGNDILQYILFTNLTDKLGSTVATNNTPTFSFDPNTMSYNTTYYIGAAAGNDLNGNVDPGDHCLDFSNAIPVLWHAYPTVEISVANPLICADACIDVNVNFSGTPPFTLVYSTPNSAMLTETFPGNSGTIEVCVPFGTPIGDWEVIALELMDGFCACN